MLHSNLSLCIQDKYIAVKSLAVLIVIASFYFQTDIVAKVSSKKAEFDDDYEQEKFVTELLVECEELPKPR